MAWNIPHGAKRAIKSALSLKPINHILLSVGQQFEPSPSLARWPVARDEVHGHVRDVAFVMTNPTKCTIAKELFWGKGERVNADERRALELFVDLSRAADVVLDIGANTGIFAICAALVAPRARVEAFEIVPDVYEVLVRNVVRNDVAHVVTCRLEGVGADMFTMRVPSFARFTSLPTSASIFDKSDSGATVRFSSLARRLRDTPSGSRVLIKVDVEGAEGILFQNAGDVLDRLSPDLVCEVLGDGDEQGTIREALRAAGYQVFLIESDGLRPMAALEASAVHHDWLFSRSTPSELRKRTAVPIL